MTAPCVCKTFAIGTLTSDVQRACLPHFFHSHDVNRCRQWSSQSRPWNPCRKDLLLSGRRGKPHAFVGLLLLCARRTLQERCKAPNSSQNSLDHPQ